MQKNVPSIYLFTGKGGVGKTSLAISFFQTLAEQIYPQKPIFITLSTSGMNENSSSAINHDYELIKNSKEWLKLDIQSCAIEYMTLKLKSAIISQWIGKTSFFQNLIGVLPSFNYLLFLGKIVKIFKEQNIPIVIDAPSTGHTLTLLNSPFAYGSIINQGALFQDILEIKNILFQQQKLKIFLANLPLELSILENGEFLEKLSKIPYQINLTQIFNNCYSLSNLEPFDLLPMTLKFKLQTESSTLSKIDQQSNQHLFFPHFFDQNIHDLNLALIGQWKKNK